MASSASEKSPPLLLGQVEVAEHLVADPHGHPEERAHRRVVRREAVRRRVRGDLVQPQRLGAVDDQAQQPVTFRQVADLDHHLVGHAVVDERAQPSRLTAAEDAERGVLRVDQRAGDRRRCGRGRRPGTGRRPWRRPRRGAVAAAPARRARGARGAAPRAGAGRTPRTRADRRWRRVDRNGRARSAHLDWSPSSFPCSAARGPDVSTGLGLRSGCAWWRRSRPGCGWTGRAWPASTTRSSSRSSPRGTSARRSAGW